MRILRWLARQIFRLRGWQLVGQLPPTISKAVIVVAPHTSNWDGFYGLLFCFINKLPIKFAIKKEALFFPIGSLLKRLGAIAIDRQRGNSRGGNMVPMMAALFQEQASLMLVIAPEGTRRRVKRWKRGFYHVAQQAGVPIVLGFIDYGKRHIGFGPVFYATGDVEEDLRQMQAFYQDKVGKYPEQTM